VVTYEELNAEARIYGLKLMGGLHPKPEDSCPEGTHTLLLIGPDPQGFWPALAASPEVSADNPVDAYSERVIGAWAHERGAQALYPFSKPLLPFVTWALRSGRCHLSPVNLLVHDQEGLMVSFRGALALAEQIALPSPLGNPCDSCIGQPCRAACPVDALAKGYDTDACHGFLETPRNGCMSGGCAVRRACSVSHKRPDAQSAHHMKFFHR